jgi:hypothetical protein
MNYKKIFGNSLIIVAIFVALIPITDAIYGLMNSPTDLAFIGPILWFCVIAFSFWLIVGRVKAISNTIKQYKEWQQSEKKVTGRSSKKKENKKN